MQLLTDVFIIENLQVLEEGTKDGCMKVCGVFGRAEEENNNGRIYPNKVLGGQVTSLQDLISERRLCGELDHPSNETVKLSNASHLITKLEMRGNDLIGEAEILKTPAGLTAQALINGGVKVGISSRGMGTLSEDYTGKKVVNEDYKLVTFDLVADPSTRGAYPGLAESTQSKFARETQGKLTKEGNFVTMLESKLRDAYQPWIEEATGGRAKAGRGGRSLPPDTVGRYEGPALKPGEKPKKPATTATTATEEKPKEEKPKPLNTAFELVKADGHWHRIAEALAVGFGKKKVDEQGESGGAMATTMAQSAEAERRKAGAQTSVAPIRRDSTRGGNFLTRAIDREGASRGIRKDLKQAALGKRDAERIAAGKPHTALGRGAAAAGKGLMGGVKKFQQWRAGRQTSKSASDAQLKRARSGGGVAPQPRAQQAAPQQSAPPADAGGGAQRGVIPRDIRAQGERRSAQQAGSKSAGREAEIAATTAAAQNAAQNPGDATAAQNRGVSSALLARAKNISPEQQAKIERMKNRKGADGTGTGGNKVGSKVRAGLQPGASITTPSYHTRPRSTHSAAAGAGARARAAGAATPADKGPAFGAGIGEAPAPKPKSFGAGLEGTPASRLSGRSAGLQMDRNKLAAELSGRRGGAGNRGTVRGAQTQGKERLTKAHGKAEAFAYQGLGRFIAEAMGLYEESPEEKKARLAKVRELLDRGKKAGEAADQLPPEERGTVAQGAHRQGRQPPRRSRRP